jgi:tetratricopeptide (TPR) repeat protein
MDERRDFATALRNIDPTNELACRALMETYARQGNIAAALKIYKELWELLDRDYGMEPSPATEELVARIKLDAFSKERDLKEDNLSPVPTQRRAAIEPIWEKQRLTIPKKPTKIDLDKRHFLGALSALRSELEDFAEAIEQDPANFDKRPAAFFRQLSERVPRKIPSDFELFRLGHFEFFLHHYSNSVEKEWPRYYAARYAALVLQFEKTIRQSPLWRDFQRNASAETVSSEQVAASLALARKTAEVLRLDEAKAFVDPILATNLEELAKMASGENTNSSIDDSSEASKILAVDLVESVNNVFKSIGQLALEPAIDAARGGAAAVGGAYHTYRDAFGKGATAELKKMGRLHGTKAVQWLARLVVWPVAASVSAVSAYNGVWKLMERFPEAFGWLQQLISLLK